MSKVYVLRSAALPQPLGVWVVLAGVVSLHGTSSLYGTLTDLSKYKPLLAGLFTL